MIKKAILTISIVIFIISTAFTQNTFFLPFMQKAVTTITVDCILDEWNFCFPIDLNQNTVPIGGRAREWLPENNNDCSGFIKMMWDESYLYVAAQVKDDVPGIYRGQGLENDGIEVYLGNWNIDYTTFLATEKGGWPDDDNGRLAIQIAVQYDAVGDNVVIIQINPGNQHQIQTDNSTAMGVLWPDKDGYTMEAKILWTDIFSEKGNKFQLSGGEILPASWSLFDIDHLTEGNLCGYQFAPSGADPSDGPGKGWQVLEVKEQREEPYYKFSSPYIKQAANPVNVDGVLDEWNFCFPVDMNIDALPPDSRTVVNNWLPENEFDCSGTIYMMYDMEYLYIAAEARDEIPGIRLQQDNWMNDGIEIYLSNYNIGSMDFELTHTGFKNSNDSLEFQIGIYYDFAGDTTDIILFCPKEAKSHIQSENTIIAGNCWPNIDGWTLEARISIIDFAERFDGRTFDFIGNIGGILPCNYVLVDFDEEGQDDPVYLQYSPEGTAPYKGPGKNGGGWFGVEVAGTCILENLDWLWEKYTGIEAEDIDLAPEAFKLFQNYPNPFNPVSTIRFDLVSGGNVSLIIYNMNGEIVKTVLDNEFISSGVHSIMVDLSDQPSGVYFYDFKKGLLHLIRKMMLLK